MLFRSQIGCECDLGGVGGQGCDLGPHALSYIDNRIDVAIRVTDSHLAKVGQAYPVGRNVAHPTICHRCVAALAEAGVR